MTGEPFESCLELVVLEGGGKGTTQYLSRTRITLGRQDASDEPNPSVITFPEPTVSRVHALLEWDKKRRRYLLTHRSRTNATVLNGTQMMQPTHLSPGDKIKMGLLVLELRAADPAEPHEAPDVSNPVETGLHLLELNGPNVGDLHPLNYDRFLLGPAQEPDSRLLSIEFPGDWVVLLEFIDGCFVATPVEGETPFHIEGEPGLVKTQEVTPENPVRLTPDSVLVVGELALSPTPIVRAGDLSMALKRGRECHPLQSGLRLGHDERLWDLGEEHVLRVISGPKKGTMIWLDPVRLEKPVSFGREDTDNPPTLVIPDKEAGRAELEYLEKSRRFLLRNAHSELPLGHNWDELSPTEEIKMISGDRFRLGRSVVRYEYLPLQEQIDQLAVLFGEEEIPFARSVNLIGYSTHCDLRINDRRLGPTHAQIEVRDDGLYYHHRNIAVPARVNGKKAERGQDVKIEVGDEIQLAADIVITIARRSETEDIMEAKLIGPTQEQIEAARAAENPDTTNTPGSEKAQETSPESEPLEGPSETEE